MDKRHSSFSTGILDSLLQELQGVVHPDILAAPRLNWREVCPRFTARLLRTAIGEPWVNHLAFMVVVLTSYTRLDRSTIRSSMYNLHARWRVPFPAYPLTSFNNCNPATHPPHHLHPPTLPTPPPPPHASP